MIDIFPHLSIGETLNVRLSDTAVEVMRVELEGARRPEVVLLRLLGLRIECRMPKSL